MKEFFILSSQLRRSDKEINNIRFPHKWSFAFYYNYYMSIGRVGIVTCLLMLRGNGSEEPFTFLKSKVINSYTAKKERPILEESKVSLFAYQ